MKQQTLLDFVLDDKEGCAMIGNQSLSKLQFHSRQTSGQESLRQTHTQPISIRQMSQMSPQYVGSSRYETKRTSEIMYSIDAHENNGDDRNMVQLSLFTNVIRLIEQRLSEFDLRLDNKEKLEHINALNRDKSSISIIPHNLNQQNEEYYNQIYKIGDNHTVDEIQDKYKKQNKKTPQELNKSDSSTVLSPFKKSDPEGMISRMNLFEKRQKLIEERFLKNCKEEETFRKTFEQKLEVKLQDVEIYLQKFSKQGKDLISKFDEFNVSQKQFTQMIDKIRNENQFQFQQYSLKFQDQLDRIIIVEDTVTILNQEIIKYNDEISDLKTRTLEMENEIFRIFEQLKDSLLLQSKFDQMGRKIQEHTVDIDKILSYLNN